MYELQASPTEDTALSPPLVPGIPETSAGPVRDTGVLQLPDQGGLLNHLPLHIIPHADQFINKVSCCLHAPSDGVLTAFSSTDYKNNDEQLHFLYAWHCAKSHTHSV